MDNKVEQALLAALTNWNWMAKSDGDEAEAAADAFQASFYRFIDAVREWYDDLRPQPRTVEEMMELPTMRTIFERLPAPLHLNVETEAELIFDKQIRIDDDKYD